MTCAGLCSHGGDLAGAQVLQQVLQSDDLFAGVAEFSAQLQLLLL